MYCTQYLNSIDVDGSERCVEKKLITKFKNAVSKQTLSD